MSSLVGKTMASSRFLAYYLRQGEGHEIGSLMHSSGRRRARRALVALLGLACALWIAQGLFYFQLDSSIVSPYDVRVSDEEVSLDPAMGTGFYYVSDYSWRVEKDRLYLTYYCSYLTSYLPMGVLGRTSARTGRRINWIILVCGDGECLWWEADPSAPGRPDLPKVLDPRG